MTRFVAAASVPAEDGERYVRQLAKHWAHSLSVDEAADATRVVFPRDARGADWPGDALVTFVPDAAGIACTIDASDPAQRDGLKTAVARHLDRFAFREAPLAFDWKDR